MSYCGKDCTHCPDWEKTACCGCLPGPGERTCPVGTCCRERGLEDCARCAGRGECALWMGREETRQGCQEELARRRQLGKWLRVLFWLFIPMAVGGLLGNENVALWLADGKNTALWLPRIQWAGQLLQLLCMVADGLVLLRLAKLVRRYKAAGVLYLVTVVLLLPGILLLLWPVKGLAIFALFALVGVEVLSLVAMYQEQSAHREAVAVLAPDLAEKWRRVRKWTLISNLCMTGSTFLIWLFATGGVLFFLAASIGVIIVGILRLVYLYRSAGLFLEQT